MLRKKLKLERNSHEELRDRSGARWIITPADPFANSDLPCVVCDTTVSAGEEALYCLDGGDIAHPTCAAITRQKLYVGAAPRVEIELGEGR